MPIPILPTTFDLIFAVLKISPTKLVVVVFPFVPVIAIIFLFGNKEYANSKSV